MINRRFGQSFLPLTFYITLRRTFSEWEYCLWSFERISYVTKILELKNIHCFLTYFALHSWILMIVKQKWWSWSESWFTSRHTNVSLEPEAVIFFLPKKNLVCVLTETRQPTWLSCTNATCTMFAALQRALDHLLGQIKQKQPPCSLSSATCWKHNI